MSHSLLSQPQVRELPVRDMSDGGLFKAKRVWNSSKQHLQKAECFSTHLWAKGRLKCNASKSMEALVANSMACTIHA